jgi:quercetin dioxygenase-like cupin family protein
MLKHTIFKVKSLNGTIYDFPEINDILPMHTHDENNNHITIIARGSFKISGNGWEREAKAGDVLDWKDNDPHQFEALETNSRIVNITK